MSIEQVLLLKGENEVTCLNHFTQGLTCQRSFLHGSSLPKKKLGRARPQGAGETEWGPHLRPARESHLAFPFLGLCLLVGTMKALHTPDSALAPRPTPGHLAQVQR